MNYRVHWTDHAKRKAAEFYKSDPAGIDLVLDAVGALSLEPRPPGASRWGDDHTFRIHVGRYRLLYEVTDTTVTVLIAHVGRTP